MQCTYYCVDIDRQRLPAARKKPARKRRRRRTRINPRGVLCVAPIVLLMLVSMSAGIFAFRTDVTAAGTDAWNKRFQATETTRKEIAVPEENPVQPGNPWTQEEAEALAKAMWGEARGCCDAHIAAVGWCALNRVDSPLWSDDLIAVLSQKNQFCGYDPDYPVDPRILAIAEDVLARWYSEKETGMRDPGRVLPEDYYFFTGDGLLNWFRTEYEDTGIYWDWSLPSPYGN